jgi:hypothetical protein
LLALLLYVTLGRNAALAEITAEAVLGLGIAGGGGGRRLLAVLRSGLVRTARRPAPAA